MGVKGLENFHMQTVFLCYRLHANTLIFTSIKFISVRTASANNLFHNFPTPLPHRPVKKIMVRPSPFLICILYLYANFLQ